MRWKPYALVPHGAPAPPSAARPAAASAAPRGSRGSPSRPAARERSPPARRDRRPSAAGSPRAPPRARRDRRLDLKSTARTSSGATRSRSAGRGAPSPPSARQRRGQRHLREARRPETGAGRGRGEDRRGLGQRVRPSAASPGSSRRARAAAGPRRAGRADAPAAGAAASRAPAPRPRRPPRPARAASSWRRRARRARAAPAGRRRRGAGRVRRQRRRRPRRHRRRGDRLRPRWPAPGKASRPRLEAAVSPAPPSATSSCQLSPCSCRHRRRNDQPGLGPRHRDIEEPPPFSAHSARAAPPRRRRAPAAPPPRGLPEPAWPSASRRICGGLAAACACAVSGRITIGASSPLAPWTVITRMRSPAASHLALDLDLVAARSQSRKPVRRRHRLALVGQRLGEEARRCRPRPRARAARAAGGGRHGAGAGARSGRRGAGSRPGRAGRRGSRGASQARGAAQSASQRPGPPGAAAPDRKARPRSAEERRLASSAASDRSSSGGAQKPQHRLDVADRELGRRASAGRPRRPAARAACSSRMIASNRLGPPLHQDQHVARPAPRAAPAFAGDRAPSPSIASTVSRDRRGQPLRRIVAAGASTGWSRRRRSGRLRLRQHRPEVHAARHRRREGVMARPRGPAPRRPRRRRSHRPATGSLEPSGRNAAARSAGALADRPRTWRKCRALSSNAARSAPWKRIDRLLVVAHHEERAVAARAAPSPGGELLGQRARSPATAPGWCPAPRPPGCGRCPPSSRHSTQARRPGRCQQAGGPGDQVVEVEPAPRARLRRARRRREGRGEAVERRERCLRRLQARAAAAGPPPPARISASSAGIERAPAPSRSALVGKSPTLARRASPPPSPVSRHALQSPPARRPGAVDAPAPGQEAVPPATSVSAPLAAQAAAPAASSSAFVSRVRHAPASRGSVQPGVSPERPHSSAAIGSQPAKAARCPPPPAAARPDRRPHSAAPAPRSTAAPRPAISSSDLGAQQPRRRGRRARGSCGGDPGLERKAPQQAPRRRRGWSGS